MRFLFFMRLKINGESAKNLKAATIRALLEELKIDSGRVAVEVNLSIIKKVDYDHYTLNDGDSVEIVNFVGGG